MAFMIRFTVLVLAAYFNKVYPQKPPVVGYEGRSVLLPCVVSDIPLNQNAPVKLTWKDLTHDKVLINKGTIVSTRAVMFPEQYPNGNFSMLLQNLRQSDSGLFECSLPPPEDVKIKVQLKVELTVTEPDRPRGGAAVLWRLDYLVLTVFTFFVHLSLLF